METLVAAHARLRGDGGQRDLGLVDNLPGATWPHRYEPDVNATYQEMAAHYGVAVVPTRSYKPRDKAKVEAGVLLAERWIIARLRHRQFFSLAEANVAIRHCVASINARPFKKMDGSRKELFEKLDRPALRPLPPTRYEFATWKKAKVNIDYHVELDRHYYSVPHQLVGKVVELRLTASVLEVLFAEARARRPRGRARRAVAFLDPTPRDSSAESHRRCCWAGPRVADDAWAKTTGPSTAALIEAILSSRPHPEQGFRSALGIIRPGSASRHRPAPRRRAAAPSAPTRTVVSSIRAPLTEQPPLEPPASSHPCTATCAARTTTPERKERP